MELWKAKLLTQFLFIFRAKLNNLCLTYLIAQCLTRQCHISLYFGSGSRFIVGNIPKEVLYSALSCKLSCVQARVYNQSHRTEHLIIKRTQPLIRVFI